MLNKCAIFGFKIRFSLERSQVYIDIFKAAIFYTAEWVVNNEIEVNQAEKCFG